nr:hypothetical protein [Tanacetum cinerariifolium]
MFLKYSAGQIPPKKSREKGSQGKKTVVVSQETADVSKESKPEPAKKRLKKKLQILCKLSKKERKPVEDNQVLEAQVKELVGYQGFLMSPQSSLIPHIKELVLNQGFSMRKKLYFKRMLFLNGDQRMKVNTLMILNLILMTKRRRMKIVMMMKKEDADDEDAKTEFDEDEIYKYKIRVHKDEDEKMLNTEVEDSGKGNAKISDVAKADAKKIEEIKDEAKKPKLPPTSSSLFVSLGFGDQFLKLSSDTSLVSTVKDTTNAENNSLLDIKI